MSIFSKKTGARSDLAFDFVQLRENVVYSQQLVKMGSWTHNLKTNDIFLTDEVYKILGCNSTDFDGKLENFYTFVHPDDLPQVKEALQEALTGKEYDLEYRIVTAAGQTRFVHEKTKVIYDAQNSPIKMIGVMQDTTDHKLREDTLKEFGDELILGPKSSGCRQLEV